MIETIEHKNHQLIDDSIDFNYLNDNLFFEAINLILPKSVLNDVNTKKIQRSSSVPNDLVSMGNNEHKKISKFDHEDPFGTDYRPLIEKFNTQVFTCMARSCGLDFVLKSDLIEHLKSKHEIKYEEYTDSILKMHSLNCYRCDLKKPNTQINCNKKLDSMSKITNHILKEHSIENEITKQDDYKFLLDFKNEIIVCSYENCSCLFVNKTTYRKHKELVHQSHTHDTLKHICDICGSKFTRPNHLTKHLKTHENMKFKCDYCPQVFMKQSMLLTHLSLVHKNEKKIYKCPVPGCDREFICKMYLDTHMTKVHPNGTENNLYCFECKKQFAALWLKNQHDEIKHKGNKLFKCLYENCGKTFPSSSKLQRHAQVHLKEKKYKCEHENCTAEFNRREHLISHINVHNDGKPFLCDHPDCKATFRYYNNLLTHKKFHKKSETTAPIDPPSQPASTFEPHEIELIERETNFDLQEPKNNIKLANEKLNDYLKRISNDKTYRPAKRARQHSLSVLNTQPPDVDISTLITHSPESLPSDFIQSTNEFINLLDSSNDQEHVININSDDEEYTTCTVVLENLFGSARTDYKSNHVYIEKYRSKQKLQKDKLNFKRVKSVDSEEIDFLTNSPSFLVTTPSPSSSSTLTNSSLDSIKSTLKQTLTSKQQQKNRPLTNSLSLDLDPYQQQNNLIDNTDVCFINCLDF